MIVLLEVVRLLKLRLWLWLIVEWSVVVVLTVEGLRESRSRTGLGPEWYPFALIGRLWWSGDGGWLELRRSSGRRRPRISH